MAQVSSCQAGEKTERFLKRQHLHRVLAATLPFKQINVPPNLFHRAIDQTQKRWAWFMESRELDTERGTELGTLGYLPWEVRQQILKIVYDRHFYGKSYHGPRTLCYEIPPWAIAAPNIFDFSYSYNVTTRACWVSHTTRTNFGLRRSSATLGFEYEGLFLSNTIFKFKSPTALEKFLGQLSDFHQTKLRRIIIDIWVLCGCRSPRLRRDWRDGWKTACFQLPASLRQVSFELDYSRPRGHNARSCFRHGNSRQTNEIKAVANLVEILSKMVVRSAPEAVIEMHERARKELLPEELELFDAAVNDVER